MEDSSIIKNMRISSKSALKIEFLGFKGYSELLKMGFHITIFMKNVIIKVLRFSSPRVRSLKELSEVLYLSIGTSIAITFGRTILLLFFSSWIQELFTGSNHIPMDQQFSNTILEAILYLEAATISEFTLGLMMIAEIIHN